MAAQQLEAGGTTTRASTLRPFVVDALAQPPGLDLHAALLDLTSRRDLTARELVEVTVAWKRMESYCAAGKMTAVADLDDELNPPDSLAADRPAKVSGIRRTADELAPALGIAPRAASALVALTRRCQHLPAAVDALADGRMDPTQLRVLDKIVRDLPPDVTRGVEAAAVRWAPRRTAQQLEADLTTEAQHLDPDYTQTSVERGVADRDVHLRPSPLPGCRRLVADLPMIEATAAWHAVNGIAAAAKAAGTRPDGTPETRRLPQLRADALTALLTGTDDPAHPALVPERHKIWDLAETHVVVGADTLTRDTRGGRGDLPAHVPGVGPVDPATARAVADHTRWRRLVADPITGTLVHADAHTHPAPSQADRTAERTMAYRDATITQRTLERLADRVTQLRAETVTPAVLDHGTTRYTPTAPLRRHVLCRDATCIGPACHHPGQQLQLDHTLDARHGGPTAEHNLAPACQRVHNAKTHGGWHLRQPRPGAFTWTSPTGRTYHRQARPLIPGWNGTDNHADGEPP